MKQIIVLLVGLLAVVACALSSDLDDWNAYKVSDILNYFTD